jgi:hypothetical protein
LSNRCDTEEILPKGFTLDSLLAAALIFTSRECRWQTAEGEDQKC